MASVATLSRVEIDIFLSSASPGQQAIVRALRDIITRRASGLTERVNTGKELIELKSYLLFEGPGGKPEYLQGAAVTPARPKRWGRRRGAGG
jgi:hypothetical protein